MEKRYHKVLGWPAGLKMPQGGLRLTYSAHAVYRAGVKEGIRFALPTALPERFEVVEAAVNDLGVRAWVVRFESPIVGWDYILVVKPSGFVITLWLNHEDDCHHTLDISKYVAPRLQVEETEG